MEIIDNTEKYQAWYEKYKKGITKVENNVVRAR